MIKPTDFESSTTASLLNLHNIEENSSIHKLIVMLNSSKIYGVPVNKKSIMGYTSICNCDSGFMCEHRLQYLINFLKKEELKIKLNKLNEKTE